MRTWSPFDLQVTTVPRFLNGEFADHPVYDAFEVQDHSHPERGPGFLVFLSRRVDRLVDYYVTPGLELDRGTFHLGAGTNRWTETLFDRATLEVHDDGLVADIRFADTAGRTVEIQVDDRDGRPRRRARRFLAPVSAGIDHPVSLMLVLLRDFDLVRDRGDGGVVRIDGEEVSTGALPGQRWHKRVLLKYAPHLTVVTLNPDAEGPLRPLAETDPTVVAGAVEGSISALTAAVEDERVRFELSPAFPPLTDLPDGRTVEGRWRIRVGDGSEGLTVIVGGTWRARRQGGTVELGLDVTRGWRPEPLPPIERVVTSVVPVFRRWPTTYRWSAAVQLGEGPTMRSGWERTAPERGRTYRRLTRSSG